MEEITVTVPLEQEKQRLDKCIAVLCPDISRSYVQKLIDAGNVFLNDLMAKSKEQVKAEDEIRILLPDPEGLSIEPENIPLDILFEDQDIIVVNKPKGLVVHPAAGHYTGTLVNGLLYHCGDSLSGINGILRPGIVHRIDKDTTGVLVVCKNDIAHRELAEQFKVHSITRRYHAVVYGSFKEFNGRIEGNIARHPQDRLKMAISAKGGKPAVTNYKVLETFGTKYAHVICELETGRTHQIRVHMSSIGHPLLGDTVYGANKDPFHLEGQVLHAGVLGFIHPQTKQYVEFQSDLPTYFTELLTLLEKREGKTIVQTISE